MSAPDYDIDRKIQTTFIEATADEIQDALVDLAYHYHLKVDMWSVVVIADKQFYDGTAWLTTNPIDPKNTMVQLDFNYIRNMNSFFPSEFPQWLVEVGNGMSTIPIGILVIALYACNLIPDDTLRNTDALFTWIRRFKEK